MNPDGSNVKMLSVDARSYAGQMPSRSPDATKSAFYRGFESGGSEISTINADRCRETWLTDKLRSRLVSVMDT